MQVLMLILLWVFAPCGCRQHSICNIYLRGKLQLPKQSDHCWVHSIANILGVCVASIFKAEVSEVCDCKYTGHCLKKTIWGGWCCLVWASGESGQGKVCYEMALFRATEFAKKHAGLHRECALFLSDFNQS
jgi:hypothetical protein